MLGVLVFAVETSEVVAVVGGVLAVNLAFLLVGAKAKRTPTRQRRSPHL
ncbi:MAG TPA: hypothetical protein VN672_07630 [Solirubrobacteraceae bacterium]|nr:hypothetical protein [Solirubrobacteraceae bacterium]